jgi:hypothetical protein
LVPQATGLKDNDFSDDVGKQDEYYALSSQRKILLVQDIMTVQIPFLSASLWHELWVNSTISR